MPTTPLTTAPVQTTLAVTDLERARRFYRDVLGLQEHGSVIEEAADAAFTAGEGTQVYLYVRDTPSGSTATACSFAVNDVPAAVSRLRQNGVTFEEYDFPGLKTEDGVATLGDLKAAWFKDPDGNILAVSDRVLVGTRGAQVAGQTH